MGCQHLDVEACAGLCMCEVGGGGDDGGVTVSDGVRLT